MDIKDLDEEKLKLMHWLATVFAMSKPETENPMMHTEPQVEVAPPPPHISTRFTALKAKLASNPSSEQSNVVSEG